MRNHLTLWRPLLPHGYSYNLSVRVPGCQNCKWRFNLVWYRMLYSCTHMPTVGVKVLSLIDLLKSANKLFDELQVSTSRAVWIRATRQSQTPTVFHTTSTWVLLATGRCGCALDATTPLSTGSTSTNDALTSTPSYSPTTTYSCSGFEHLHYWCNFISAAVPN